jgi:sec-independent protein translocase protein TatC
VAVRTRRRSNPEGRMTLGQHLLEIRRRLAWIAGAVLAGTIGGWFLYDLVWPLLERPIQHIDKSHQAIINFTNITGAFDIRVQIAFTIGIVISSPVWLYEIFAFLVPALNRREKRYIFTFIFTAIPLFLAGCTVGWIVFPHMIELMSSFVPAGSASFYDAKYYLDFVLKLVIVVGFAFELPVFLVLLNFMGVLRAKTIVKGWRWAVLSIVVFTAIATPAADISSMMLLALPMTVLYFVAIGVSFLHDRRVDRRKAAEELASSASVDATPA